MNVTVNQNMVKLAKNKSLLKEFDTDSGRTVYLNDNDEYQIQLYNPETAEIAASIFIDGEELSNQLIIRPGERIWLERYLDTPRKFRFSTYEVEDNAETEKAISYNGCIEVKFYKKAEKLRIKTISDGYPYYTSTYINNHDDYSITNKLTNIDNTCLFNSCINTSVAGTSVAGTSVAGTSVDALKGISDDSLKLSASVNSIETGRTGKGSYSDQTFYDVDMDFASWPFKTENIKILPQSRKPYTANDLEKIYCSECGRKLKPKYKFCPYCGTKIDY